MEIKKIFLASAAELKDERNSFARFIREINEVMKLQNIELEAEQWEFKEKAIQGYRIQDMYNNVLADCEICVVLFWTRCGMYSQEELNFAYDKFKEGLNPRKIYVFFKNDSSKSCSEELIEFKKGFPKRFGENFPIDYSGVDELKYTLSLEIAKYFGSDSIQIQFDNRLIDFSKLPCFKRNKDYAEVLRSYKKALARSNKYPNDKSFKNEKEAYEARLNDILADLIKTARIVDGYEVIDNVSDDVNKAISHFYQRCQYDEVKRIIESVANPFNIVGVIKPEFYCDRIKECERVDRYLLNGENLLLISPRRSGKTSFFRNRMCDSSSLSNSHYFVYCDLYTVKSIEDFAFIFNRSVYQKAAFRRKTKQFLQKTLKALTPIISYDINGLPTFSIGFSDSIQNPIEEISTCFELLEGLDKPCVLCFDEFQQLNYCDSNNQVEGIIYNYMNTLKNVRFMFIGCPRFYSDLPGLGIKQSIIDRCTFFSFDPIKKEDYQLFAQYWFHAYSKEISTTAFSYIYDFCNKSPYYIQRVLHRLFMETKSGEICQRDKVSVIIDSMVREATPMYNEILHQLTRYQLTVLYCFSKNEHDCDYQTLDKQLRALNVPPSRVRTYINSLIDKEIISYFDNRYYFEDVFFSYYLKIQWGNVDRYDFVSRSI